MPPRTVLPGHNPVLACDKHPGGPRFHFAVDGCRSCLLDEASRASDAARRATQLAAEEAASINRDLDAAEQERVRQHSQNALDLISDGFFKAMQRHGGQRTPRLMVVNSAFELEQANGGGL
jgi:hypothetical protein